MKKSDEGIPHAYLHLILRVTSFFYMLDCGFVMFFGDRPRIAPYEVQHSLPTHEHVYQASSASDWASKYVPTNPKPFPELLNAVLSPFSEFPTGISVAGHFMLLHGATKRFPNTDTRDSCGNLDSAAKLFTRSRDVW